MNIISKSKGYTLSGEENQDTENYQPIYLLTQFYCQGIDLPD